MRQDKLSKQNVILYLCGIIPVVWLGLLIAPCLKDGLPGLVQQFGSVMQNPFQIQLCEDSVKTVLTLLLVYGIAIGVYLSTEHNYRRREEHGSAKWGTAGSVNKKYANKDKTENKLLTQNVAIGLDGRKHRRNLNVLVCGGSGAGKTRFYAKPNIMNANTSFVVLDPKGELLRDTGHLLEEKGYEIKVLDLIDMEKSHCYNPFVYISSDDDIQRLTTNLFKNTTPKGSQTQDPFWDQTAAMLLKALVCYLHYEAPPDEQNFSMVMEMIRAGDVKEDNEEYQSVLDELFERLEERNPEHIALKYYRAYHSGSAKTLKSIQISLVSRLEKFNLDSLAGITQCDEMDLGQIGEKKTAVFAVIPDNDSSFNFIVGMLYTQLFQQLYYQADSVHGGRLPVHVHFVMDEFANVALPDEFDKLLSTMRSREISVSIIIQNLAQLKALFEKQWESIVGNCDEFLYLGGNEQSTHEYVSKLLGKETIDTNTYGRSRGRNGSYSTNYQLAGRELMTPDEVRMLDNRYALLFIRGERPIRDLKYDILHHPNVALTTDGSAPPILTVRIPEVSLPWRSASTRRLSKTPKKWRQKNTNSCSTRKRSWKNYSMKRRKKTMKKLNAKKNTNKPEIPGKVKKGYRIYVMAVLALTLTMSMGMTAFAAGDPITVVNNLSDFIFGLIRAVGLILLGWGIVQVGLSFQSHDPSQRSNGFLTLAGGVIITFAKEILNLIVG